MLHDDQHSVGNTHASEIAVSGPAVSDMGGSAVAAPAYVSPSILSRDSVSSGEHLVRE